MDLQLLSVGLDGLESQRCGSLFALNCASILEAKDNRYSDACVVSVENPRAQSAVALEVGLQPRQGRSNRDIRIAQKQTSEENNPKNT